jgi:hypothetical protein
MDLRLTVVIPNWNGLEFLQGCLDALEQQTQSHSVVVVDNGSTDGSGEFVERHYPEVSLLSLDHNQGFAGGVNRGIEIALERKSDFVALLNNDAIVEKDWLEKLVDAMQQDPKIGIVTSKILRQGSNLIHSTGDFYSIWAMPFPRGLDEIDVGQYDDKNHGEVFAGSGGASLYRVGMLEKIGLFDEDYFAYYEDTDISFRAHVAGWRVRYEPKAVVHHFVGGTSSKISGFTHYHSVKNLHLLYWRNMPGRLLIKYFPRYFVSMTMVLGGDIRKRRLSVYLRATRTVLILVPKTLRQRAWNAKQRVVSTTHIDSLLWRQPPPVGLPKARLKRGRPL